MKMNTFRFACYFFNNLANWLTVTVDTVWREAYNEDSHELCETHKFKKLKYFSRRMIIMKKGCPYGTHRVISPKGVLPQPADVIDNTMEIYDNEVLIDVKTLNIDSASFTEIERRAGGDVEEIKKTMLGIVAKAGKHKNPWTGSGGMLIGTVKEIGPAYEGDLKVGRQDRYFSIPVPDSVSNRRNLRSKTGNRPGRHQGPGYPVPERYLCKTPRRYARRTRSFPH